jgi:galactokinase
MLERIGLIFADAFGGIPDIIARAPGRVNLIGEHTDYNDGFALPMAIGCQTMVAARRRNDGMVRLLAADLNGEESCFAVDADIKPDPAAPWSNYIRGVAHTLINDGLALAGAEMVISGDIPKGAGLSSSASLEVASGLAFATLAGVPDYDRTRIALAGQRAEHDFAGCNCGIMDQLASAHGQAGHALLIDCRSLDVTPVAMPSDVAVMIVHSGIERGLVDGEYNARRMQCEAAARNCGVEALRDIDMAGLEAGRHGLDLLTFARARNVVSENARTLRALSALGRGDLAEMGRLMAESHVSLRDDFAVSLPAIDDLVVLLQRAIGPEGGARMTGGGFGGAVVAVMAAHAAPAVQERILQEYQTPSGEPPYIMVEQAAAGASVILP